MSFFATEIIDQNGSYFNLTPAGYGLLVAVMLLLLLGACYLSGRKQEKQGKSSISTKQLAFCSVAIALGMVTSCLKLFDAPYGGSVTLFSMLFICLIGYWFGLKTGLMAACAYGILQLIVDPYIISIPQMLTDYLFAFGSLGLSGLFSGKKHGLLKGYLFGVLGRFFFTFLSGMIFFGAYAADWGMSIPVYSFAYNGSYIGAEAVLTIIILAIPAVQKGLASIKTLANS
jgi:thiamine transporter